MAKSASKFYSIMVVGNNPDELMAKYKIGSKVEKYLKYKYLDAEKVQKNTIKIFDQMLDNYKTFNLSKYQVDVLQEKLKAIKNMTPFEYYQTISYGCTYDENGDAWSDINPNGKWNSYFKGNHFSVPLINNKGEEVTSELNRNINWKLLHLADASIYELVWDMVMEGKKPENEEEQRLYDNMKNREVYFSNFKNKDEYVAHNSAYWNYAYLDSNGWVDVDDKGMTEMDWITNFFNRFITKLNPTDKITIFEFTRNNDEEDDDE